MALRGLCLDRMDLLKRPAIGIDSSTGLDSTVAMANAAEIKTQIRTLEQGNPAAFYEDARKHSNSLGGCFLYLLGQPLMRRLTSSSFWPRTTS